MPRTLTLAAELPATPERLFDMYLDPKLHAAFTGTEVEIDAEPGSAFHAFDGALEGSMLYTQPKRLIVQSWRSRGWEIDDIDSTLVLSFHPQANGARIEVVHANLPESDYAGVSHGWERFYWTPWRAYLEEQT